MPVKDQGAELDRYRIIPRVLIFLFNKNDVLLIKGAPDKRLWANRYNGLGGHIERGEDALSAAHRELLEETGLIGCQLYLCGTVIIDAWPETGIGLFVFRGETKNRQTIPSHEGLVEWIPIHRLEDFPLVEDLPVILPRIITMREGDPPFSARYYYDTEGQLQIVFAA